MSKTLPGPPIRDVSLAEMLDAMAKHGDEEVFRWYQTSYVSQDGSTHPADTLRLTMKAVREALK